MNVRSLLLTLLLSAASVGGSARVEVRVTPELCFAPATLQVQASIAPHPLNRAIQIDAESDTCHRSASISLDGERSPETTTVELRGLPGGEYRISVTLVAADGRRDVATRRVSVVAAGRSR